MADSQDHDQQYTPRVSFGMQGARFDPDALEGPVEFDETTTKIMADVAFEVQRYADNYDPENHDNDVVRKVSVGYSTNLDVDWGDSSTGIDEMLILIEPVDHTVERIPGTQYFIAARTHEGGCYASLANKSERDTAVFDMLFKFDVFNCEDKADALALLAGLRQLNAR